MIVSQLQQNVTIVIHPVFLITLLSNPNQMFTLQKIKVTKMHYYHLKTKILRKNTIY